MRDVARTGVDNCPKCRYYFGPDALQSAVQGGKGKGKGKVKVKPEEVEGGRLSFPTREDRTGSCREAEGVSCGAGDRVRGEGVSRWRYSLDGGLRILMGSLAGFLVRLLR